MHTNQVAPTSTSRYTSIKTRIETEDEPVELSPQEQPSRYTSIKTRIETPNCVNPCCKRFSSRYTSIKTRIETPLLRDVAAPRPPLATLPSKQGLKRHNFFAGVESFALSLHFHQNKD